MKIGTAAVVLLGGLVPMTRAQPMMDQQERQTVICIPDKGIDNVLNYYVSSSEHPFCMNGGTCKTNFEQSPDFPCDCPAGLTGPHCEFEEGIVPECELDCFNGGRCQAGIKHPSETVFKSDLDLQYCICPEGYYGKRCEVEGKRCGASHCFNGGSCVQIEQDDGTVTDHCDCSTAGDDKTSFAGRYCQSSSSVFCSKFSETHEGKHFCVNGGECRNDNIVGCDCPAGFTGPVCEFRVRDEEEDHANCNLQCHNSGICRKGKKDLSILETFNVDRLDGSFDTTHTQDFEHCVCPIGYVGLACEFRLDVCPGGTHACMHGAECIPSVSRDTHKLEFHCDCDKADDHGLRYAGKYCQFESSEFCTDNAARPPDGTGAFCVNGGACKEFVPHGEKHPGCQCENDFQGDHCEYPPDWADMKSGQRNPRKGGMAIALTLGATLLALLAIFVVVYRRQKARELAFRPQGDSYYRDDQHEDSISSTDGDLFKEDQNSEQETDGVPTIEDIDLMVDNMPEKSCEDLMVLDSAHSIGPSETSGTHSQILSEPYTLGMSSLGTFDSGGSGNSRFTEDLISGRAKLMKEADDTVAL